MLKDIIAQSFRNLNSPERIESEEIDIVIKEIKNIAKKLFFDGKINELKDYIFDNPNPNSNNIHAVFCQHLTMIHEQDLFLQDIKNQIRIKLDSQGLNKDLDGLLAVLDYSHLKGFLSMFKL
ncbi:MAG: hypothetical protein JNL75_07335 [Chitinophagales bacterium]|mgnify:CR=1 FL=1|nr:hypothetical protein [Chitinophagales bacterium]